jgi:hypothetical protein
MPTLTTSLLYLALALGLATIVFAVFDLFLPLIRAMFTKFHVDAGALREALIEKYTHDQSAGVPFEVPGGETSQKQIPAQPRNIKFNQAYDRANETLERLKQYRDEQTVLEFITDLKALFETFKRSEYYSDRAIQENVDGLLRRAGTTRQHKP